MIIQRSESIVKFWVKIIIALMVVLVIGFSVWVFFFREKEDVQAHNRLSELIDYKESLGIEEKMIELRNLNYLNGNKDSIITTSSA